MILTLLKNSGMTWMQRLEGEAWEVKETRP